MERTWQNEKMELTNQIQKLLMQVRVLKEREQIKEKEKLELKSLHVGLVPQLNVLNVETSKLQTTS